MQTCPLSALLCLWFDWYASLVFVQLLCSWSFQFSSLFFVQLLCTCSLQFSSLFFVQLLCSCSLQFSSLFFVQLLCTCSLQFSSLFFVQLLFSADFFICFCSSSVCLIQLLMIFFPHLPLFICYFKNNIFFICFRSYSLGLTTHGTFLLVSFQSVCHIWWIQVKVVTDQPCQSWWSVCQ